MIAILPKRARSRKRMKRAGENRLTSWQLANKNLEGHAVGILHPPRRSAAKQGRDRKQGRWRGPRCPTLLRFPRSKTLRGPLGRSVPLQFRFGARTHKRRRFSSFPHAKRAARIQKLPIRDAVVRERLRDEARTEPNGAYTLARKDPERQFRPGRFRPTMAPLATCELLAIGASRRMRIQTCAAVVLCALVIASQRQEAISMAADEQHGAANCGWIGVQVTPMTAAVAASLGMVEPYGAIFGQPEPGSPAAAAGIAEGDVVTRINGESLRRSNDFAATISAMAPGSFIDLRTYRNGALTEIRLMLASSKCPDQKNGEASASQRQAPRRINGATPGE
jgi:hypothetical protein